MSTQSRINRRKPRKYKGVHTKKTQSDRRELTAFEGAFVCGAAILGGCKQDELADYLHVDQSTISRTVRRSRQRAEDSNLPITDPYIFENEIGRGRKELLTEAQKDEIVQRVTQDREHREMEAEQLIEENTFEDMGIELSVTTLQNVMYERGYSRKKQGYKPELSPEDMEERYQWALDHNPDLYTTGDNLGFNFRRVVYSDETPARVGEQRGMHRAWIKEGEKYNKDVKKPRILKYSQMQFYGCFTYDEKGPCHIYNKETEKQKKEAEKQLQDENKELVFSES